jgi:hypothetical protein
VEITVAIALGESVHPFTNIDAHINKTTKKRTTVVAPSFQSTEFYRDIFSNLSFRVAYSPIKNKSTCPLKYTIICKKL